MWNSSRETRLRKNCPESLRCTTSSAAQQGGGEERDNHPRKTHPYLYSLTPAHKQGTTTHPPTADTLHPIHPQHPEHLRTTRTHLLRLPVVKCGQQHRAGAQ